MAHALEAASPGARRLPAWLPVLVLLAVGAAVRALRFWGRLFWWAHWDDARYALPAMEILGGELPVQILGLEYLGAAPSYPLAVWFAVAGASTLALDLFDYGVGLGVLTTAYLVARRLLPPRAALLALAVLAVPPLILARWSLIGNLNQSGLLIIGNLLLLATHTLFFRRPGRRRTLLVLGVLAGLGWWTNPLIVVYLAPFGLLAVRTALLWRARAGLVPLGVLLGGLPAWLYELQHFPSSRFALAGSVGLEQFRDRLALVAGKFIPSILGVDLRGMRSAAAVLPLALLLLWGLALIRAAREDRRELAWTIGLGGGPAGGRSILWWVALTNLALILATSRTPDNYYLLSLYSVAPCWMGEALSWLARLRPALGRAAVVLILGAHLWANWVDTLGRTPAEDRRWAPVARAAQPLMRWLDADGIRRAYWVDPLRMPAYEFSYLAERRVVAASLWNEEAVSHGHLVDAAEAPPILLRERSRLAGPLRESLRGIGMAARETRRAGILVLEPLPTFQTGFVPIRPDGWAASASENGAAAANLIDGDASTGWRTAGPQRPGQWIAVDLGREETVARVDLLAVEWREVPVGFRVEVFQAAEGWREVVAVREYWGPLFFSEHHAFLKARRGRVQAIFPPRRARRVRVVQTGEVAYQGWAARELFVYGPGPGRPSVLREGELTAALRQAGVSFVYANHWLSARVQAESRGRIGALPSNINLNAYGRTLPPPESLDRFRAEPGHAILVGSDGDPAAIRAMLAGQSVAVRDTTAGPYPLLVITARTAPPARLARGGWRATASENAAAAPLAVDGDRGTAWASTGPARPAMRFTLDLGQGRRVSRVAVRPGPGAGGLAPLRLEGSMDGRAWTPLQPLAWAGPVYWSGSELLRHGKDGWAVSFPATALRYLRLSPAVEAAAAPWVIEELECFD